jgi:hypothetical protein
LRIELADHGIAILVMDVYRNHGLRERLFGSTRRQLLEDPPRRAVRVTLSLSVAQQVDNIGAKQIDDEQRQAGPTNRAA